jgi:hypothetical protein
MILIFILFDPTKKASKRMNTEKNLQMPGKKVISNKPVSSEDIS